MNGTRVLGHRAGLAGLSVFAFLLLTARPARPEDGPAKGEWVIGECAAMSGPAAGLGRGMHAGLKAAIDEANAKGGVHGRMVKLLIGDDEYEPEKCVDCTAKMIEESQVNALAGYVGTPTAKVAIPIIQETKVPLVGIFSGAMLLREPLQHYVINVRSSYDDETEALVQHLNGKLGFRRIAVLYQNDSFGLAGLSGTEKALGKRGLSLASKGTFERTRWP
jgi:branched-chain amino acid transport system substrate-binding protein